MRIAIIGGGASGLMTAWLLQGQHQVDLYEKQTYLGGNVRTLGRNVTCSDLPEGVVLENGVTGFHKASNPNFLRLLNQLNVPVHEHFPKTGLFFGNRAPLMLDSLRNIKATGMLRYFLRLRQGYRFGLSLKSFIARVRSIHGNDLRGRKFVNFLSGRNSRFNLWMRALAMESYSTAFQDVDALPAEIGIPIIRNGLSHSPWMRIEGGVYTYMQHILARIDANIFPGTQIRDIQRRRDGVKIRFAKGSSKRYDKVVLAVTPGQVLRLLANPTDQEKRGFGDWSDRAARTIAHTDHSFYPSDSPRMSVMDFFDDGRGAIGYNCNMNNLHDIPGDVRYSFAMGLDALIDPHKTLDNHIHRVPRYTSAAVARRRQIIERNGDNHTFFAGAYLGDGLHEGAATSALAVARLLSQRQVAAA
ncbi:MAG: FAD-dependent oxidoreductase [Pirellulaceae bacterium]